MEIQAARSVQASAAQGYSNAYDTSELHARSDGGLKGHLYVASAFGYYSTMNTVEQFRFAHGVPVSSPSRTYQGVAAPIAVDSAGYLYATSCSGCSCGPGADLEIFVYSPRSEKVARQLWLPVGGCSPIGLGGASVTALFVDPHGYLFAGTAAEDEGHKGVSGRGWAAYVFAPGASGYDYPVQEIDGGSCRDYCAGTVLPGLAMDAQGNLHVSSQAASPSVLSYASPATGPKQIGDLTGAGIIQPSGLAVDAFNELYVDNNSYGTSFVAAYRAKTKGRHHPDREISVTGAQSFGSGIATAAGRLIVTDPYANAVYAVRARENGAQMPIWTLSLPSGFSPQDVKLGP